MARALTSAGSGYKMEARVWVVGESSVSKDRSIVTEKDTEKKGCIKQCSSLVVCSKYLWREYCLLAGETIVSLRISIIKPLLISML